MRRTTVCIAGGGPAGLMLGLLLARSGIEVTVLEKHEDFFRDFRGDTVHPSTLNLIDALGLRARFEAIDHVPLQRLDVVVNGIRIHAIDFSTLPAPNRLVTLMPQWDLLELLAAEASTLPAFRLEMGAEVADVVRRDGRVTGVRLTDGAVVEADLVVACDGRASTVREAAGLVPRARGVPTDVAWFRMPRPAAPMPDTLGWIGAEGLVVTIPRPGYLQCGLLIPKGSFDAVRAGGIEAFRQRIARAVPRCADVVGDIASLDDVKLLSVQIDRLPRWWTPGLLCIGDAAHAMSPVFGVGINYAVQDAVAAARLLAPALRRTEPGPVGAGVVDAGAVDVACAAVQRRRDRPTGAMQAVQRAVHARIASGALSDLIANPPTRRQRLFLRAVLPRVKPLVARLVGYGFRPERLDP
ncbi:FAD-dependent oxidoreductase [Microbacterium mangrovi]|uniref:FAD-dependent oxidoreductase n=1 Tax=Microbacterium mangrovi TaxID=1348253 RepID=UPI000A6C35F0|nr:FAD-dependent oxidoreductase [Microbacterium mangrovi]